MKKLINQDTFPYAENGVVAPYTDGLLESDPVTNVFMAPLGSNSCTSQSERKLSGTFQTSYVGDTGMVFADNIWYPQNAGDS